MARQRSHGARGQAAAAAPAPQQIPAHTLKQTTYQAVNVEVQPAADGGRLMIMQTPFEMLIFPMTVEAAESIGRALCAPSVHVPEPIGSPV